jgi:microsomal dipeptidase-like Zn-dependent dipeptidase
MAAIKFIDLHAHYPMHLKLPKLDGEDPVHKAALEAIYDLANETDNYAPVNKPRVTADLVHAGGVSGFASVLYDPEDEFLVDQAPHAIAPLHILKQISNVEADAIANGIAIVKTRSGLDACLNAGTPFLVHCMEGGHGLGTDPGFVDVLANQGVAYIILAHLRYMGLASVAKGLPCKGTFWQNLINQGDPDIGLTAPGQSMVEKILASRCLLDVTHCSALSRAAIRQIYAASGYTRPVISSHTGATCLANYELNVTDDWIQFIAKTGGVIGVIFFPFWLADNPSSRDISLVYQTIDHIRNVGGDDCVAIGTDLDGFIQPIRQCPDYSYMSQVAQLIADRYSASPDFVEKVLYGNARRVLMTALG